MRLLLLTGSHPRHFFIVNELAKEGLVTAHIIEKREEFIPKPPVDLEPIDRENFIRHFNDRERAEEFHFQDNAKVKSAVKTLNVTKETLNSEETIAWIAEQEFDLAISYGVHKIMKKMLAVLPKHAWNIHGGLSPWYKGNTTLFWPFIMLRPNWTGMTIHRLTDRLDAGDIVHHSVPVLAYGDGIHDVACKAVLQAGEDLRAIIENIPLSDIKYVSQKGNGKLWIGTDWMPQHLRFIYNTYDNDIVDQFLDGKLSNGNPETIDAFLKK